MAVEGAGMATREAEERVGVEVMVAGEVAVMLPEHPVTYAGLSRLSDLVCTWSTSTSVALGWGVVQAPDGRVLCMWLLGAAILLPVDMASGSCRVACCSSGVDLCSAFPSCPCPCKRHY